MKTVEEINKDILDVKYKGDVSNGSDTFRELYDKIEEMESDKKITESITKDDVAMFIEDAKTLEELVSDLKKHFNLTDEYLKERKDNIESVLKAAKEHGYIN